MPKTIVSAGDPDEPVYNVVNITPELAKKWLAQNTHNRNLRERSVTAYAADMRDGNWVQDGQGIRFAKGDIVLLDNPPIIGGALLDGQHRLSAIVEANATIRMLVVSNLRNNTQETMDTGAKRSFGDVLKLRGEGNYVPLAATLARAYLWQQGARKSIRNMAWPTHRQLIALLEDHPEIRRSAEIGSRVRNVVRISPATAGLCHWLFVQIDESDCAFFFARLTDGAGLMPGDPIYALRRAAETWRSEKGRRPEEFVTAIVIKAWNAFRDGKEVSLLQYRPGGAAPEAYPEPK